MSGSGPTDRARLPPVASVAAPGSPGAADAPPARRAWLRIDLAALRGNLAVVAGMAGARARVAAVVKANAYGHGLVEVARALAGAGAGVLCVATVDEALALRSAAIGCPVLLLYPPPAAALDALVAAGVWLVVSSEDGAAELRERARRPLSPLPGRATVHVEVETGLTRMGIPPDRVPAVLASLSRAPQVVVDGLWSHLADGGDADGTATQVAKLELAAALARAAGQTVPPRHLAASAAILAGTVPAYDLVRPGLALYGVVPDGLRLPADRAAVAAKLRPVLSLHALPIRLLRVPEGTRVSYGGTWVARRPSSVATLPLGYGDGYARGTGPGAEVLVRGRRAPVVGAIAMDALMVDVTDIPGVTGDDEFVLLGAQGGDAIDARELAQRRTSISWEVLTAMATRLPRVYHPGAG